MNCLWVKYLPQLEERIANLEKAARGLATGELTTTQRAAASSDAHKLAGVLGTFGLQEGTELAREAEQAYDTGNGADSTRLAEIASILRTMVDGRNRS
jgi:HPt (histidine-containing phosphotransfer) domain-containing protein